MAIKVINSLRLTMTRFTLAFLKVEITHNSKKSEFPPDVQELVEILHCFSPTFFFKIRIEPKIPIEEFTGEELEQIAEFVSCNSYFDPFNKFFYQVIKGNDDAENFCTVLDYTNQDGTEVEVLGSHPVGAAITANNPFLQVVEYFRPSLKRSP